MSATPRLPLAVELRPVPDVESALLRLAAQPHSLLLDSALRDPRLGRYSFLTADPFEFLTVPVDQPQALDQLAERLQRWPAETRSDLPPFQGGAAGLLSYDLARSLERVPPPQFDEFGLPALAIGLYDTVLAIDHAEHRAWLISQGFPKTEPAARLLRAQQRIEQFRAWLEAPPTLGGCGSRSEPRQPRQFAPQFPMPGPKGLTSTFSAAGYRAAVQRAIDYIHAGDIFQVNLAQRLLFPATGSSLDLYLRLRQCNPAPFAGWFDLGDAQLISRYTGVSADEAPLHKLGSGQWDKAKRRAAEQVRDSAAELLNIYARRATREGHAFRYSPQDYESFANDFGFEETPDQNAAIHAVIQDMISPRPMDRLVCGDVASARPRSPCAPPSSP